MSTIANLVARLGFNVDTKGLAEFEKKLDGAAKKVRSNSNAVVASNKRAASSTRTLREQEHKLYTQIKRNYSKIRTTRAQAESERAALDKALSGNLTDAHRKQLIEARGRVQQRLDDLIGREKKAQDKIANYQRKITEKRDYDEWRRKSQMRKDQITRERARQRNLDRERQREERRIRNAQQKRDYEEWQRRSRLHAEAVNRERLAERQLQDERRRLRSIQERRDYELWRRRGEQLRQERSAESRAHQARLREATQLGRARGKSPAGHYRGLREQARAWIPGIGGAYTAIQSTRNYQQYVGMGQALAAATGSKEQGQEELSYLVDLAQQLGVYVGDLTNDYAKFAASTVGTSVTLEQQREIFKGVTAYTRVLNLSADDTKGVFRA